MQKKIFSWAMCMAVSAMFACTGCSQTDAGSSDPAEQSVTEPASTDPSNEKTDSVSGKSLSAVPSDGIGVTADDDDLCGTYDSFDAEITLQEDDITVTGDKDVVTVNGNQVVISDGGTYRLTGTRTNGQVIVTGSEKVKLYLDGVLLTNPSGPAIVSVSEKRTILSLAEGTENQLADGRDAAAYMLESYEIDPCALYAQDKLTINGSGSLTVRSAAGDGILCKDDLKLVDGQISVDAANNGVKGKDCVALLGASLRITAGNDGMKATETEDAAKGYLQLEQGTVSVEAGGDCLQAETLVWITGGSYSLTSTGTSVDETTDTANSAKGVHCAGNGYISGGTLTIDAPEDGVHCGGVFDLSGGTLQIQSGADGIQSDGDMTISGGTVQVTTTGEVTSSGGQDDFGGFGGGEDFGGGRPGEMPSGMPDDMPENMPGDMPGAMPGGMEPADGNQNEIGGASVMQTAYQAADMADAAADTEAAAESSSKGLKCGGNLVLSGGSCNVVSTDHSVHAAGSALLQGTNLDLSSENKGISVHGDLEISDGNITIQRSTEGIESKASLTIRGGEVRILDASDDGLNTGGTEGDSHAMSITGGYVYVNAAGDGVDSNDTWEMSGGTLLVCGPVSGGDGSLDANGTMTYTGGTLLALSSRGMMEYPESGCLVNTNCSISAGDTVCIVGKDGTVLAALTTPKAVSDVIFGIGDAAAEDFTIVAGGVYDGTQNADGFGTGGTVSGGTEITGTSGSGNNGMNGGQPGGRGGAFGGGAPGGRGGAPNA